MAKLDILQGPQKCTETNEVNYWYTCNVTFHQDSS